jgi:ribonuclease-3
LSADLAELERRIGHVFADRALLEEALTHPSLSASRRNYERMEFVGDRVLGLVVADLLFRRFPAAKEGDLAHRFNGLVCEPMLADLARALNLSDFLRLDAASARAGVAQLNTVLANTLEAVFAAVYLDAGLEGARTVVATLVGPHADMEVASPRNAKSELLEYANGRGWADPVYEVAGRSGPDHAPHFVVRVTLRDRAAEGEAGSKKAAEMAAAAALLKDIKS